MSQELSIVLSSAERELLQSRLLELLAHQIELYTHGESSSVRVELAQELFSSICYCLGISPEEPGRRGRELLQLDISQEFYAGRKTIQQKTEYGRKKWREVCDSLPAVLNVYLLDTLKGIGRFWKRYDVLFFAHQIPCSMDYPLSQPVSDALLGVDYVNAYLEQLERENQFLTGIPAEQLKALLDRSGFDYRNLPINLCELAKEQLLKEKGS